MDAQQCTAAFRCMIAAPVAERMLPWVRSFEGSPLARGSCDFCAASCVVVASVWCNRNDIACIYSHQTEAIIIFSSAVHNSYITEALPASFTFFAAQQSCTTAARSPFCGFGAANDKCCAVAEIKGMIDDSLWANVSALTLRPDGCDISPSGLKGRPMDI